MASLYFHTPFCKRLCGYCDFHRSVKLQYMPRVVEAMHKELVSQHNFLNDRVVRTIYFGGGTPSLLHPSEIERFVELARSLFDCSQLVEITIEVNPDDVTAEYVEALRRTSVNRISIGVQSLDDATLLFMGRRHTAEQAQRAVSLLQSGGYTNISVDVIFGVAGFDAEVLERTLQGVLAMDVQHISAYHLTIESGTRFGRLLAAGTLHEVAEEQSEAEYLQVHNALTQNGFEHYEVSNYAKMGYRSRHNSSYWQGVEYLGIGPGAHSFAGDVRRWCEQSVEEYAEGVEYGSERLTARDHLNEYIMTSLRCVEGLSLDVVEQRFGREERLRLDKASVESAVSHLLEKDGAQLKIAPEKMLLSDSVIAELMV